MVANYACNADCGKLRFHHNEIRTLTNMVACDNILLVLSIEGYSYISFDDSNNMFL